MGFLIFKAWGVRMVGFSLVTHCTLVCTAVFGTTKAVGYTCPCTVSAPCFPLWSLLPGHPCGRWFATVPENREGQCCSTILSSWPGTHIGDVFPLVLVFGLIFATSRSALSFCADYGNGCLLFARSQGQ